MEDDESLALAGHRGDPQDGAGEASEAGDCEQERADQEVRGEEREEMDLERVISDLSYLHLSPDTISSRWRLSPRRQY